MNKKIEKVIELLKSCLIFDSQPSITQDEFDLIVDILIQNDERELLWRLCAAYPGYNYNKVVEYFIGVRDVYHIRELVSFVCGELEQDYLVNKMIETNDKEFIKFVLEDFGGLIQYNIDDMYLEKLLDFVKY